MNQGFLDLLATLIILDIWLPPPQTSPPPSLGPHDPHVLPMASAGAWSSESRRQKLSWMTSGRRKFVGLLWMMS